MSAAQNQYVVTVTGTKRNYYHPDFIMNIKRVRVIDNFKDIDYELREITKDLREVTSQKCERFVSLDDMNKDKPREIISI